LRSILPLPLLAFALACSGTSAPPPPVPTPTPGTRAADGTQPLSSREAATTAVPAPPGTAANLPPGHPPIDGGPTAAPPLPAGHPPVGQPATAATRSAGSIAGTIRLSPAITSRPSDILYVMAKSGGSTLAVKRIEKPAFPLAFEIGGGDLMMGGQTFEGAVDVVARLSRTGDAIASKGDAEGTTRGVKIPAKGVSVTIDSIRQ
jgi:hypothetical protein